MNSTRSVSGAELIRQYSVDSYVEAARRRGDRRFSINAGEVHKALKLENLVPSVCNALASEKFRDENRLRLVSKTGPPSGKSTTVTYTYEFLDAARANPGQEPWERLRGALKDVFAEFGGGEAYLRGEREAFRDLSDRK